jgi:hypothetical protein
MVLDRAQERIVCRTTSPLEAFRVARRRTGGSVKLDVGGDHGSAQSFGITVVGRRGSATVIRVANDHRRRSARVAIPVGSDVRHETVRLPDGSAFTWIPAAESAMLVQVSPRRD